MSHEVRRVPADWQHPTCMSLPCPGVGPLEEFRPLFGGSCAEAAADWDESAAKWAHGLKRGYQVGRANEWIPLDPGQDYSYEEYAGERPLPQYFMPEFPYGTATHYMLYEISSEGTPISPPFATPEELALWLVNNEVTVFADRLGTYDQWLAIAKGGPAPEFVFSITGPA